MQLAVWELSLLHRPLCAFQLREPPNLLRDLTSPVAQVAWSEASILGAARRHPPEGVRRCSHSRQDRSFVRWLKLTISRPRTPSIDAIPILRLGVATQDQTVRPSSCDRNTTFATRSCPPVTVYRAAACRYPPPCLVRRNALDPSMGRCLLPISATNLLSRAPVEPTNSQAPNLRLGDPRFRLRPCANRLC
jgi:hypothetical protein